MASPFRWIAERRDRNRRRRGSADGTMSLKEHLYDLRHRISMAMLFITLGTVFGFFWWEWRILGTPSLGDIVITPYCGIEGRFDPENKCQLLQTKPFEAFMIRLKVGAGAGAALVAPLWLYQVWSFIAPGLYAKERKFAITFVSIASVLFALGALLAFYVVPQGLSVLVGFGDDKFLTALTGGEYINFVLAMLLIFGVSFELPLIVVMLNRAGVVSYEKLNQWRRGILFGLFVFAAIATPGTDPISMVALAVALCLLFEMAIQIARVHDKREAKKRLAEGWDGLADDEATPFDYTPSDDDGNVAGEKPAEENSAGQKRVNYDEAT